MEHDVYVSYREESGAALAGSIAAALTARGFRVLPRDRETAGGAGSADRPTTIEEIPDFVLVLTPHCLDACADERDPLRAEISLALRTERNIVPVAVRGYEHPPSLPPDLAALRARQPVPYSESRAAESVARIAHRLSSDAAVDERHLMRDAQRIFVAVGLLALVLLLVVAARTLPGMIGNYLRSRPLPPMTLYWSVFAQHRGDRADQASAKDGSHVVSGDQFRVVFSLSGEGRAYVVARDTGGDVVVLFPASRAIKDASAVRAREMYSAPGDGTWWAPEAGVAVDRLYVFGSYDPIENLEALAEQREESLAERQSLLEATIEGLLDGKHGGEPLRIRTRSGRRVLRSLQPRPLLLTASATLDNGGQVTRTLVEERGLLSAMVEISVVPAR